LIVAGVAFGLLAVAFWSMIQSAAERMGQRSESLCPLAIPLSAVVLYGGWQMLPDSVSWAGGLRPVELAGSTTFGLFTIAFVIFVVGLFFSLISAPFRKGASPDEEGLGGLLLL